MGRKSIFRFSLRSPPPPTTQPSPLPLTEEIQDIPLPEPEDPSARYIPRQWAPNRLQTLYVTPSEQNLYLAAMAQLDRAPPPLPLWTEPAPTLPPVAHQAAMDPTPPSIRNSPRGAPLRLPPAGLSSKFVMSPVMPVQGLSVREEFKSMPAAPGEGSPSEHALLALSDDSQLRFHNFPVDVLVAVQEALRDAWPRGQRSAYPDLSDLGKQTKARQDGNTWIVVLKGNVWRQAGKTELDSIRLILALLTTLSIHGWVLVDRMQAAGVKYDNHNLLFAHSAAVQAIPPTYFAVSIPLPDRISLISPPPKATPSIISAVREAIESQTAMNKRRARRGLPKGGDRNSVISASRPKSGVEWDSWKGNIRLEGWVHPGVYRFWLGGMRRWLGNGVKWRVVEKLHPSLILTLINALSSQHFTLLTSLPLLPLVKGRDILIFASQQTSGLTYRDTWKSEPLAAAEVRSVSRAESAIMINPSDAVIHDGEIVPREMEESVRKASTEAARLEAASAMAEERRLAAGLGLGGTVSAQGMGSPVRTRHASLQAGPRIPSPTRLPTIPQSEGVQRNTSTGSNNPLTPASITSPRHRNFLVKNPSLKRDMNGNGNSSQPPSRSNSLRRAPDPPSAHQRFASLDARRPAEDQFSYAEAGARPDVVNVTSRHGIGSEYSTNPDEAEWTVVDMLPESQRGQEPGLGLGMYAAALIPEAAQGDVQTAAITHYPNNTAHPPAWNDVETPMPPPLPPRPNQPYTAIPHSEPSPTRPHNSEPIRQLPPIPTSHAAGPSFDSDRSVYTDALTPSQAPHHNLPPTSYTPLQPQRPDSEVYDTPNLRDLKITNPTPPPLSPTTASATGMIANLNIPLSQPISPMKGRDAMVDVGQGFGAESVRGSVGYMPSLASQSMLGLTPAISEGGPILGGWDTAHGNVPMPTPAQAAYTGRYVGNGVGVGGDDGPHIAGGTGSEVLTAPIEGNRKGKKRESMRNMFGFKHTAHPPAGSGLVEVGENSQGGDGGVGSSRTKVSMRA